MFLDVFLCTIHFWVEMTCVNVRTFFWANTNTTEFFNSNAENVWRIYWIVLMSFSNSVNSYNLMENYGEAECPKRTFEWKNI